MSRASVLEGGGGTPLKSLYGKASPEREPFSGFRYIKGRNFTSRTKYMKA